MVISGFVRCADCGLEIPNGDRAPREPCDNCGSTKRNISASIREPVQLSDNFGWETRKEFYEKNSKILAIVILISIGSPLLGLFVAGVPGVLAGLAFSGVSYLLGPHAVTKVREIERGS